MSLPSPLHDERRGLETVWTGASWRQVEWVGPPVTVTTLEDCSHLTDTRKQQSARRPGRPSQAEIVAHVRAEWASVSTISKRAKLRVDTTARLLFTAALHGQIERQARLVGRRHQSWYRRVR